MEQQVNDVRKSVAIGFSSGKDSTSIAESVNKVFGSKYTSADIDAIILEITKSEDKEPNPKVNKDKFDVVQELMELYTIQKERIRLLLDMEKNTNQPLPETRENLYLMTAILTRVADYLGLKTKSLSDRKEGLFDNKSE